MGSNRRAEADLEKPKEKEAVDLEQQPSLKQKANAKKSVYHGLGWLDRLLALWILLAIIIGILLGNYVDSVGPALQRGKFVQVSVPIGRASPGALWMVMLLTYSSRRPAHHDVPNLVQSQVRESSCCIRTSSDLDPDLVQYYS